MIVRTKMSLDGYKGFNDELILLFIKDELIKNTDIERVELRNKSLIIKPYTAIGNFQTFQDVSKISIEIIRKEEKCQILFKINYFRMFYYFIFLLLFIFLISWPDYKPIFFIFYAFFIAVVTPLHIIFKVIKIKEIFKEIILNLSNKIKNIEF